MPREAAKTLLAALERDPYGRHEDRLTEVLACALGTLPVLARWLIDQAGAAPPAPEATITIATQGALVDIGRPDLELTYRAPSGRAITVFSEQKIHAPFTRYQKAGYPKLRQPDDKLVLIAPDRYRDPPQFDRHVRWTDIALELQRIAEAVHGGPAWRDAALQLDAPGVLRFIYEALGFIERQDVDVSSIDPIDAASVETYGRIESTSSRMYAFLSMVRDDDRIQALGPSNLSAPQGAVWWFALEGLHGPILDHFGPDACFEICLQPEADFLDIDEPVLYAGLSFYPQPGRPLRGDVLAHESPLSLALSEMHARIGLRQGGKQGKCAKAFRLSEIADSSPTLPGQARHAASLAAAILEEMARIRVVDRPILGS